MHHGFKFALHGACVLLAAQSVSASEPSCSAAETMAHIHDAYTALAIEEEDTRREAALSLLAVHLPAAHPEEIAREMAFAGVSVDVSTLKSLFADVAARARYELGTTTVLAPEAVYQSNQYRLSGLIFATGCDEHWTAPLKPPEPSTFQQIKGTAREALETKNSLFYLAIAVLSLIFFGAIYTILRSRLYRETQLKRLPRSAISLPAIVTWQDDDGAEQSRFVRGLDISLGGLKLGWDDAAPEDTSLTLEIAEMSFSATVIWRNDFYAGVLLERQLSEAQFATIMEVNGRTPALRSVPRSKSSALPP